MPGGAKMGVFGSRDLLSSTGRRLEQIIRWAVSASTKVLHFGSFIETGSRSAC